MQHLHRTLLWRCLFWPGAEYFNLWQDDDGWRLEGTVILSLDNYPTRIHYSLLCNTLWQTRAVNVDMKVGATERVLRLTVDDRRRWWAGGEELRAVRGCMDVDLSVSPSTNTLPIRRLALAVGSSAEVTAAWVRFPDLTITPLAQKYIRVEANRYWYQSELSDKIWDIEVDEFSLVRRYTEGWEREAAI